jgi:enoyl-CoA hydratase/carnithine racemase
MPASFFHLDRNDEVTILRLRSEDGTNRLTRQRLRALLAVFQELQSEEKALVISGNENFFSVGADFGEIAGLNGPQAYEFSTIGQQLMKAVDEFPLRCSLLFRVTAWAEALIWRWLATGELRRLTLYSDIVGRL